MQGNQNICHSYPPYIGVITCASKNMFFVGPGHPTYTYIIQYGESAKGGISDFPHVLNDSSVMEPSGTGYRGHLIKFSSRLLPCLYRGRAAVELRALEQKQKESPKPKPEVSKQVILKCYKISFNFNSNV